MKSATFLFGNVFVRQITRSLMTEASLSSGMVAVDPGEPLDRGGVPGLHRGWGPSLFLLVLAALAFLCVAQRALRFTLPTDGWEATTDFESDNPIFVRPAMGTTGDANGLRAGDRVLGVAGVAFEQMLDAAEFGHPLRPDGYKVGSTVTYSVDRGGRILEVPVPILRWSLRGVALATWHALASDTPAQAAVGWLSLLLVALLFARRPRNLTVQLLLVSTSLGALSTVSWIVAPLAVSDATTTWSLWSAALGSHLIHPLLMVPVNLHLILTFPRPRAWLERRPWILAVIYGVPWLVLASEFVGVDLHLFFVLVMVYAIVGFVAVLGTLLTFRSATEQAQTRWFALGFALANLGLLSFALDVLHLVPAWLSTALDVFPGDLLFIVCIGIAVLRFHLFAIDVILERTLVYAALTALVVGAYAVVVGGVGQLVRPRGDLALSLVATALVAIAFQPAREKIQGGVTRLLYGRRDEPFQVLTDLGRVLGATSGAGGLRANALGVITETVSQALKLPYAAITLASGGRAEVVAESGSLLGAFDAFNLSYQGRYLGELRVAVRAPRERFTRGERRLLDAIARQASVAAYAMSLNAELQRSRERLVNALEEERRRIRRDLHDGLGPTLAAVSMQLDATRVLVGQEPAAAATIEELKEQVQGVLQEIRRLVYGLRPPALDEFGLVSALREHVDHLGGPDLAVRFDAPATLPALPAAVEVAVYRVAQEATANVVRHASARRLRVALAVEDAVVLTVDDDGVGLGADSPKGVGLRSMAERAEELGGTLRVTPLRPRGTRLEARFPLAKSAEAPPVPDVEDGG